MFTLQCSVHINQSAHPYILDKGADHTIVHKEGALTKTFLFVCILLYTLMQHQFDVMVIRHHRIGRLRAYNPYFPISVFCNVTRQLVDWCLRWPADSEREAETSIGHLPPIHSHNLLHLPFWAHIPPPSLSDIPLTLLSQALGASPAMCQIGGVGRIRTGLWQ